MMLTSLRLVVMIRRREVSGSSVGEMPAARRSGNVSLKMRPFDSAMVMLFTGDGLAQNLILPHRRCGSATTGVVQQIAGAVGRSPRQSSGSQARQEEAAFSSYAECAH